MDSLFSIIAHELEHKRDVKLARFGNFICRQKKQRMGRNPKTGEEALIEARRVLTFKASKQMVDRMNSGG